MQQRDRRHVVRDRIIAAEVLKLELRRAQARATQDLPRPARRQETDLTGCGSR
jgi:hypothetical protein